MKRMENRSIKIIGLLLIAFLLQACQQEKKYDIGNRGNVDIIDRAVVLNRAEVRDYLADPNSLSRVAVKDENGEWVPSQCDDMDGDGQWDELAFIIDLEAGETKKVTFETVETMPDFPVLTNIRFGRVTPPFEEISGELRMKTNDTKFTAPVYQMEGPAWENNLIAFRNYYDARNGMDIFGKKTADMVLDSVGVNGRDYHVMAEWGMDILKVGNSLGAGAIAIGIGDSLYRVGPCREGRYRLISEGPVRSVLELTYAGVPAGDRLYDVTHQITIGAGDRFYRSRVWVSDLQGDEALVTGIVDLHAIPADTLTEGSMKILASLGNQGISGEVLGMGLFFPAGEFIKYHEAPAEGYGIVSTHLVSLALSQDSPTEYYFLAAWEMQDQQVKGKDYFTGLLKEAVHKIK
jgi:hypothetical protein